MNAKVIKANGEVRTVVPGNNTDFQLDELQGFVGGPIEIVQVGEYLMVVNEEGKLLEQPFNQVATQEYVLWHGNTDVIVGDVLMCPVGWVK